ncbi:hypothetical protein [Cellulomonas iranensis]|uniref:hypothetical protein n=1 Tax=Cellulomonas iranensis TaxID=76862 RepID=UPI0013D49FDB|nr:hypothetical protein [Cellulomonas iranensis]
MVGTVQVEETEGRVYATTPYHKGFVEVIKNLGGRWDADSKRWHVDARDRDRLIRLLGRVFGYVEAGPGAGACTVRITLGEESGHLVAINALGRRLVHKRGRDERPQLGPGVVLVAGGFPATSGSMRYPTLGVRRAVLEVRDVPLAMAEALDVDDFAAVEIIPDEVDPLAALRRERDALLARVAEIDAALAA